MSQIDDFITAWKSSLKNLTTMKDFIRVADIESLDSLLEQKRRSQLVANLRKVLIDFMDDEVFSNECGKQSFCMQKFGIQIIPTDCLINILQFSGTCNFVLQCAQVSKAFLQATQCARIFADCSLEIFDIDVINRKHTPIKKYLVSISGNHLTIKAKRKKHKLRGFRLDRFIELWGTAIFLIKHVEVILDYHLWQTDQKWIRQSCCKRSKASFDSFTTRLFASNLKNTRYLAFDSRALSSISQCLFPTELKCASLKCFDTMLCDLQNDSFPHLDDVVWESRVDKNFLPEHLDYWWTRYVTTVNLEIIDSVYECEFRHRWNRFLKMMTLVSTLRLSGCFQIYQDNRISDMLEYTEYLFALPGVKSLTVGTAFQPHLFDFECVRTTLEYFEFNGWKSEHFIRMIEIFHRVEFTSLREVVFDFFECTDDFWDMDCHDLRQFAVDYFGEVRGEMNSMPGKSVTIVMDVRNLEFEWPGSNVRFFKAHIHKTILSYFHEMNLFQGDDVRLVIKD